VLDVKLHHLDTENQHRMDIARTYYTYIQQKDLRLPTFMDEGNNVYHIFPVFTPHRNALQQYLSEQGIQTLIHYPIPPHQQACYKKYNQLSLPITEQLAHEELSLPLNTTMTDTEVETVIQALNTFTLL
jgi:dTDP-4-amino-4,6-dideoxygalactose transaminase